MPREKTYPVRLTYAELELLVRATHSGNAIKAAENQIEDFRIIRAHDRTPIPKPTIWENLCKRLGRDPTNSECREEIRRIMREA